jgi:hypothetical protein
MATTHTKRRPRADASEQAGAYALRRTLDAAEAGHLARRQADDSWLVRSDSRPVSHRVVVRGVQADGSMVFGCACESGIHRSRLPVPCRHAACVGLRLEQDGVVAWDARDGQWHARRPLPAPAG